MCVSLGGTDQFAYALGQEQPVPGQSRGMFTNN